MISRPSSQANCNISRTDPFSNSDLRSAKRRPALVVQADNLNTGLPQTIVAMKKNPQRIPPVHPGDVLREEFMKPLSLSSYAVAKALGTNPIAVSQIIRAKRGVSAEMALRLARCFGTSAGFWQGLQADYELEVADLAFGKRVEKKVVPLHQPVPA